VVRRKDIIMTYFKLLSAAALIGVTGTATYALALAPVKPVVVEGHRIDPATQRMVSFADLNLSLRPDQKVLNTRISRTAERLCYDLNGSEELTSCTNDAVHSTDGQVIAAIDRANRRTAGLPVDAVMILDPQ
jgi:UrcA family protein